MVSSKKKKMIGYILVVFGFLLFGIGILSYSGSGLDIKLITFPLSSLIQTDIQCSRNGIDVSCTVKPITPITNIAEAYNLYCLNITQGACFWATIDDLPEKMQFYLGESGSLSSDERKQVYDNFKVDGACRLSRPDYYSPLPNGCLRSFGDVPAKAYSDLIPKGFCSSVDKDICTHSLGAYTSCNYENPSEPRNYVAQIYNDPIVIGYGVTYDCTLTTKMVERHELGSNPEPIQSISSPPTPTPNNTILGSPSPSPPESPKVWVIIDNQCQEVSQSIMTTYNAISITYSTKEKCEANIQNIATTPITTPIVTSQQDKTGPLIVSGSGVVMLIVGILMVL